MVHRPAAELIHSLRAVLQKVEETFASPEDQPTLSELKRILIHRIADLEFVGASVEMECRRSEASKCNTAIGH
jgi:hypothetical protein